MLPANNGRLPGPVQAGSAGAAHSPVGEKGRGLCCSLRYLYLNSSSSRGCCFLWISGFSRWVTEICVISNYVGGGGFAARADMNNLRRTPWTVDKWPVVPVICTALSTGPSGAPMQRPVVGLVKFEKWETLKPQGRGLLQRCRRQKCRA